MPNPLREDDVKVRKVGNATVVTLTGKVREVFKVRAGDIVTLVAFKGRLTIRYKHPRKARL